MFKRAKPHEYVAAWGARLALTLFGMLPLNKASAFGGWLGRKLGPHFAVHKHARRNIARAMPELNAAQQNAVLNGMWDNLGRVLAEYAHLPELRIGSAGQNGQIDVIGTEHVEAIKTSGQPAMFFTAHFGNWELANITMHQLDLPLLVVYRAANNPLTEDLLQGLRASVGGRHVPKGLQASREILRSLKKNECVGMLVDQKLNTGIAVPFFGRDAMTAPAIAEFALRRKCPVVPVHVERLDGGARFRVTVEPPFMLASTGDHNRDVYDAMVRINQRIEAWIREHPDQWFWVHKRWPKD